MRFNLLLVILLLSTLGQAQKDQYEPTFIVVPPMVNFVDIGDNEIHFMDTVTGELITVEENAIKDSLRILLVKLIGLKKLDHEHLLEKDVRENERYYRALLEEFKSTQLHPSEYAYLDSILNSIRMKSLEQRLHYSYFGIIVLLVLFVSFYFYSKKRKSLVFKPEPLSNREQRIFHLLKEGKTNKEIASELYISVSTVKSHLTNIYRKLGVSSRNELS